MPIEVIPDELVAAVPPLREAGRSLSALGDARRQLVDLLDAVPDPGLRVRRVMLARGHRLKGVLESPTRRSKTLRLPLEEPVGTVLHKDGSVTSGRTVAVVVKKRRDGVFIEIAWLEA